MPKTLEVAVNPDGTLNFIYDDETAQILQELGMMEVKRASHVEPVTLLLAPSPQASAWGTASDRLLPRWQADMSPVGGPVLGPFKTREEALKAEHDWLVQHNIPFPEA